MQKPRLFGMNGFLLIILTFLSLAAQAQQPGCLILIDAENKQTFTIRIGDQLFASSLHGHLVISQLKDSVYRLYMRISKKNIGEQAFPVRVQGKDMGFQLRTVDSSWILYNWQTRESVYPVLDRDSSRILEMGVKREDGFSKLMAAVVNDSSVQYNTYTGVFLSRDSALYRQMPNFGKRKSTTLPDSLFSVSATVMKSKDSVRLAQKNAFPLVDSSIAKNKKTSQGYKTLAVKTPVPKSDSSGLSGNKSFYSPSMVKKIREINLKISRKLVFLDQGIDGHTDTITLFVYFETADTASKKSIGYKQSAQKAGTEKDSTAPVLLTSPKISAKKNSGSCAQLATEGDVETLRSAILSANTDQDKLNAASAAFGQKCYTVSQIRLLAALFVSDKSRYRLMDSAQNHIVDKDHFHELSDMYTDKNFQKKFLALAEKRS